MIQELLGAVVEPSAPLAADSSCPSSAAPENLRCPRCDSSNTKFCYYNNYNLTQPRHFSKTCRRYWTKGGALRNVPIGGGCRKTKAAASAVSACKPTRPMCELPCNMGRVGSAGGGHGPDHDLLQSMWGGCMMQPPHSSHLLALLQASQVQQSHNHSQSLLNSIRVKEEEAMVGAPMILDSVNQTNNSWSQYQYQHQNLLLGDAPTPSGVQELYQRLRNSDHLQMIGSSLGATMATTIAASVLEPMPLLSTGGEFGYSWNPALPWADIPMPNGAFH